MKLLEVATNREIILVSGNLCSGKGHYCQTKYPDFKHIVVSNIVKSLINSSERSKLANTKYLDMMIIRILIEQINAFNKVIVDGIRQQSIIHALELHYGQQIKKVIWLDVPEDVRRQRFDKRGNVKDDIAFDQAMQMDRGLGIDDVERYIRGKHDVESY